LGAEAHQKADPQLGELRPSARRPPELVRIRQRLDGEDGRRSKPPEIVDRERIGEVDEEGLRLVRMRDEDVPGQVEPLAKLREPAPVRERVLVALEVEAPPRALVDRVADADPRREGAEVDLNGDERRERQRSVERRREIARIEVHPAIAVEDEAPARLDDDLRDRSRQRAVLARASAELDREASEPR